MKRQALTGIGYCFLAAYAAMAAGCTEYVTSTARTSLASFLSTVITQAVNTTIAPQDD